MPKMLNTQTGMPEDIPLSGVPKAFGSGYQFIDDERYDFEDRYGKTVSIPGSGAASALEKGYKPYQIDVVAETVKGIEQGKKEVYDTLGQEILTGAEGFARGATLGLSDVALTGLGISDERAMRSRREVNSTVALASEIGGAVAPALLTGGTGAAGTAGRILSATPAGQVAKLGTAIVGKGVGKGVATRVAAGTAAGVVEGAAFGTGQGISELALSDEPLSAERIVSVVGSNMLTGAAYGGAIGGALPVLGAAGRGVKSIAEKAEKSLPASIKKLLPASMKETETKLMGFRETLSKEIEQTDVLFQAAKDDLGFELSKLTSAARQEIDGLLTKAETATIKRTIDDFDKAEGAYRSIFSTVDTGGYKTADIVKDLFEVEGKELTKRLSVLGKYHNAGAKLRGVLDDFRTGVDDLGVDIMEAAPANMAGKVGGDITETMRKLKGEKDLISKKKAPGLAEVALIADVMGLDMDHIPGLSWIPEPIAKAFIYGRLLSKHGGGYLNKKMYARVANGGAADVATGTLASKAAVGADKIEGAVKGLLRFGAKGVKSTGEVVKKTAIPATIITLNSTSFSGDKKYSAKTEQEAYKRRYDELVKLSQTPDIIKQNVEAALGPVPPGILAAVQQVQMRKIKFLNSKLPKDPNEIRLIPEEYKPPKYKLKRFAKYMRAAEKPLTVLEDMKNGNLSSEGVEALRVIYPEMFSNIQVQILEGIPELSLAMSYKAKLQLSRLFEVPVDISMEPGFITAMQDDFSRKKESKDGKSFDVPDMKGPSADTLTSNKIGEF